MIAAAAIETQFHLYARAVWDTGAVECQVTDATGAFQPRGGFALAGAPDVLQIQETSAGGLVITYDDGGTLYEKRSEDLGAIWV